MAIVSTAAQSAAGATAPKKAAFMALATALKLQRPSDVAYGHAVDQALRALQSDVLYTFSGAEVSLLIPQTDASSGCWHWTDGVACSCGPNQVSPCWHALLYRLLFAASALADPVSLRAQILDLGGGHGPTTSAGWTDET